MASQRVIEIWSANAVNQISSDTSYQQALKILKAHFDVSKLVSFLAYISHSKYQIGIWEKKLVTEYLFTDRASSLENFAEVARVFCEENKRRAIRVLTYPRAYKDIEKIMRETAKFDGKIVKVVPGLIKTIEEIQRDRTERLIGRQDSYSSDEIRYGV